jgi:hypothetical protein
MHQVTKEEAERKEHLPDCAGHEDCDCFHTLWSHAEIYRLQFANYQMLHALMTIKDMPNKPGYDMRDLEMSAIAAETLDVVTKETNPKTNNHKET